MSVMREVHILVVMAVVALFFVSVDRAKAQSKMVQILGAECVKATLGSDTDEIYFSIKKRGLRHPPQQPRRIKQGEVWTTKDFMFRLENGVHVTLYEADKIGGDDVIGEFFIAPDTAPGRMRPQILRGDSSHYIVFYTVIE